MPAETLRYHPLQRLKDKIVRTRARIRHLEMTIQLQPHRPAFVVEARLAAAKLRLARLCIERQRLKTELQA